MLIILLFSFLQGFTEFLPVSSQGHLIAFNEIFELDNLSDISIHQSTIIAHFGSFFAVALFYSKTIKGFIFSIKMIDRPDIDKNSFLLVNLVISTIPIIIAGYLFSKIFDYYSDYILVIIATTSIIFGIILFLVDTFCLRIKNQNSLNYQTSLLIGVCQCAALIPGVSRSGAILTCMRFFGFQRKFCVHYSNLLSLPVILAATTFMLTSTFENFSVDMIFNLSAILIFVFSFLFSIIFIFFFVNWVKKFTLFVFVFYRVIFGILLFFFLI